jgi:hypothetical protein
MGEVASVASKVSPMLGGRVNSTGRKIAAKFAVLVAVSGSVFAFSVASPTAKFALASPLGAHQQEGDTYIRVSGDRNDWRASGSHRSYGHIQLIFPDGRKFNSRDSDNPNLSNVSGDGSGKVTAIGWKLISPGKYESVGEPSVYIS